jgi:hypothetical protein
MRTSQGVCPSRAGTEREGQSRAFMMMLRLLLIAFVLFADLTLAADDPDSDHVSELLVTAKAQAFELKSDIQTMDFFTGSDFGWESHASIVNVYKGHISAIRQQVARLDDARSIASPLQKKTIDQVGPLLQELASDAEGLINRINKNPKRLDSGEYKEYIKVNADLAAELAALVGNFVDCGRTKQQLEQVKNKIDLP